MGLHAFLTLLGDKTGAETELRGLLQCFLHKCKTHRTFHAFMVQENEIWAEDDFAGLQGILGFSRVGIFFSYREKDKSLVIHAGHA